MPNKSRYGVSAVLPVAIIDGTKAKQQQ